MLGNYSDNNKIVSTEHIVRGSNSSFYWAMRRLPREKRAAMYAIYSFCRIVDDIADDPGTLKEKASSLDWWRNEINNLFRNQPNHIITEELVGPVNLYGLEKQDFHDIIDGMVMDASETMRIRDFRELEVYCDRVACAVGRLSVRVFGIPIDLGMQLAHSQGHAMQLTNILRDVIEDMQRGRLYLPTELIQKLGVCPDNDTDIICHPKFPDICDFLALKAEGHYNEARQIIKKCNGRVIRPAKMMLEIYHVLFSKLVKRGWVDINTRMRLSKTDVIFSVIRHGIL
mgnify:CR=1 FL=1